MNERAKGRLFLLGAGGHGRVVADIAEVEGWKDIVFLDDRWPQLNENLGWPVIGTCHDLASWMEQADIVFVTIGSNRGRLAKHRMLTEGGFAVPTLVHHSAVVSTRASVGAGAVIMPNAVVNAGTVIGDAVIVNTGSSVDHDCRLGDGVHVGPGARLAGGVTVGEASLIGIGAVVREYLSIGKDVTVGAGAAVVSNIDNSQIVMGVPATSRKQSARY